MHRFVEPPHLGRVVVTLLVYSWEIECCAPPPVVGDRTSWRAFLEPIADREPWVGVVEHEVRARAGDGRVLVDDAVVAHWDESRWGPRPESARITGELCGTAHGGFVPDELPPVEGRVERVRVVRRVHRLVEGNRLEPLPGTTTVADVRESPRWFTSISDGPSEIGVLVDVHVPAASLPAHRPTS